MRPTGGRWPAGPVTRPRGLGLIAAAGAVALAHLATVWALSAVLVRSAEQRPLEAMVGVLVPPAPVTPPAPLPVEPPSPPPPPPPLPTPTKPRPVKPAKVASPPPTPAPVPDVEGPPSDRAAAPPQQQPEAPLVSPAPVGPIAAAAEPAPAAPAAPAAPSPSPSPSPLPVTPPRSDAAHLNNPAPTYPALSRRLGEQGRVLFDVHILADGSVGQIRLKRSSGFARLDQAALEAVRHWRYQPARRGGEPIPFWYVQPIDFSLGS